MLNIFIDKIRLLFLKERKSYLCFYKLLGFYPKNIKIYQQALLHKSSSIKAGKSILNNERLEFLGDAILDAIVADIVYQRFKGKSEGFLTNTRSKIVQRETLNRLAVQIGLDKLIKYTTRQASHNSYMCGNAFEALIGAIYLDKGYEVCKTFVEKRIINRYINLEKVSRKEVNFKSKLIEWGQKNKFIITFDLTEQSLDEEQNPIFTTQVIVEQIPGGKGKGYSKKESQQEAAHETLNKIGHDPLFIEAIFAAKNEREAKEDASSFYQEDNINDVSSISEEMEDAIIEHYEDTERIIATAEEEAFNSEKESNE